MMNSFNSQLVWKCNPKQRDTCIKENKARRENPTRNSTLRRRMALYGEINKVRWHPLVSQTSQYHIFLQRHTEKSSHISKNNLSMIIKYKSEVKKKVHKQYLSPYWLMTIPKYICFDDVYSTFLALRNQIRPCLESYWTIRWDKSLYK